MVQEETYANTCLENKKLIDAEAKAIHMILNGIGDDIYSTVYACSTAREIWLANEHLQQGETINKQDVKTKLFWEFEWSRFVTIIKQQKDLDTVSYHILSNILKQHQNEVNEIRAEKIARNANPLILVAATQHYLDDYTQPTYDAELFKKVQSDDAYNVFATKRHHSEQPRSISDIYVVETVDINVITNSSDICDNKGKAGQNAEELEDECVLLASLIANLKLDVDENKTS
nr:hypothetical protein [Tanacetum cinerariifolium]